MDSLLDKLIQDARNLAEPAFANLYPRPALLLRFDDDEPEFVTKVGLTTLDFSGRGGGGLEGAPSAVRFVEKSDRNPYSDRIAVGRTQSCDIVVRHPSVSKLHAHFVTVEGGWLALRDAGSRNGTAVNGETLGPDETRRVQADDVILFGRVEATLVYPVGLHRALLKLDR